jgi:hypothetical protein
MTKPAHWKEPITAENKKPHGCLICEANGALPIKFHPESIIAVGFGSARLMKGNECVYDEQQDAGEDCENAMTGAQAEALAAADPDHDWRIVLFAPLDGRTYQRQGENNWVLIEQNEGFA